MGRRRTVPAGEVGVQRVEVAGLLHAVADRLELIREMLATGVRGIEIGLDHHGEAAADDAIAVAPVVNMNMDST